MSSFYPPKIVARLVPSTAGSDLHCRKCHHLLAGLKSDEKCPQCGLGVTISMRGTDMRYCDPAWVNRLRRGSVLVLCGTLLGLVGLALAGANAVDKTVEARVPASVIAAGGLIYAVGNWFLTSPDPSGLGEKSYGRSRKSARFAWISGALGIAGLVGSAVVRPEVNNHWLYILALVLCDCVNLFGSVAMLRYLSKLSVRMRDTRISERARTLGNGLAVVGAAGIAIVCVRDFVLGTQWAIENDLAGLVLSFQAIAGLSGLVLLVVWILLLIRLAKCLKEQAKLARTMWETPA